MPQAIRVIDQLRELSDVAAEEIGDGDTLHRAIAAELLADPAIAGFVGDRVYPDAADQSSAYPHLVFEVISIEPEGDLDGHDGTATARVRFIPAARKRLETLKIARALDDLFQDFSGDLNGVFIRYASRDDDADDFDRQMAGSAKGIFRTPSTFTFRFLIPDLDPE